MVAPRRLATKCPAAVEYAGVMVGHTTVHDAARALAQASARFVTTRPSSIPATMEVGGADRHHSWSPRPMLPAPSIILAGTHGYKYSPVAPTDTTPGLQRQYRWSPEAISSGLQTSKYSINGRLEHLRGSALGFRNLTHYIARCLLESGGFRPVLHSYLR